MEKDHLRFLQEIEPKPIEIKPLKTSFDKYDISKEPKDPIKEQGGTALPLLTEETKYLLPRPDGFYYPIGEEDFTMIDLKNHQALKETLDPLEITIFDFLNNNFQPNDYPESETK